LIERREVEREEGVEREVAGGGDNDAEEVDKDGEDDAIDREDVDRDGVDREGEVSL
jgi:hypothetical protein